MFTRSLVRFVTSSTLAWAAAPAGAVEFFPNGECAIVIASRPSVVQSRAYILENGWANLASVYQSANGWFAISVALVQTDKAAEVLNSRKAAGYYPQDAYCSTGQKYVRQVNWQEAMDVPTPSGELWSDFDARPLSAGDKRFLQAALAMQGDYSGLLDGAWGRGSQGALERYTAREFDTSEPTNGHAGWLALLTIAQMSDEGWDLKYVRHLDISMYLPIEHLTLIEDSGTRMRWEHDQKDLQVIVDDYDLDGLIGLHNEIEHNPDQLRKAYAVRSETMWVTSIETSAATAYVRSDKIAGTWSTVGVFAGPGLRTEVALISSSIRPGKPIQMLPDENGALMIFVSQVADFLTEEDEGSGGAGMVSSTPPDQGGERAGGTTGTAFFVNRQGIALTNAHVVASCRTVTVDGKPAEILNVSTAFDLAALKLLASEETESLPFARKDAGLNSDITIAGYPLHGLLGGLNVSRGSVSALKGLAGDEVSIQISAPVQPGNSGGPAINSSGGVVGVVVSKLNALALAGETGDIAQNVNFAIRGTLAKVFLASNAIDYVEIDGDARLAPEETAARLQATTFLVECK